MKVINRDLIKVLIPYDSFKLPLDLDFT